MTDLCEPLGMYPCWHLLSDLTQEALFLFSTALLFLSPVIDYGSTYIFCTFGTSHKILNGLVVNNLLLHSVCVENLGCLHFFLLQIMFCWAHLSMSFCFFVHVFWSLVLRGKIVRSKPMLFFFCWFWQFIWETYKASGDICFLVLTLSPVFKDTFFFGDSCKLTSFPRYPGKGFLNLWRVCLIEKPSKNECFWPAWRCGRFSGRLSCCVDGTRPWHCASPALLPPSPRRPEGVISKDCCLPEMTSLLPALF